MKKAHVMQNRRRARELAMQFLYSLSPRSGPDIGDRLNAFISEEGFAPEENSEVEEYLRFLARGVWRRRFEIDTVMREVVTGWRPESMVTVDRMVLKIAIFEGFLEKNVPLAVAIAEAVELASAFGTEESGKFVNGVLGKMARLSGGIMDIIDGDHHAVAPSKNPTDR